MEKKSETQSHRPRGFGGFGPPPTGAPGEKARDFKGTIKKLVRHLKPYTWQLVVVLVFVIASTAFA
ncbi:MAG TPA: ABC transporter ATP-binding protein, partial [Candidatus Saccharibacteria bacterium]|nr:ABC transporter ATP-binding protein [Candidatus Saccharibacteria bacterium]